MRKLSFLLLSITFLFSCKDDIYVAPSVVYELEYSTKKNNQEEYINDQEDIKKAYRDVGLEDSVEDVDIYGELAELFNPDYFDCGLSQSVKNRLKSTRRQKKKIRGFVPDLLAFNAVLEKPDTIVSKLKGDKGANVLLHLFQYKKENGELSKSITPNDSPIQSNFNIVDLIDKQKDAYSSLYFSMDCSGYFSATTKALISKRFLRKARADVEASASVALDKKASFVFMRVLLISPLHAAFVDSGPFNTSEISDKKKKKIYNNQIKTLEAILNVIPESDRADNTEVFLNVNYEAIIASNKGNSSYNGEGSISIDFEVDFFAKLSGAASSRNSINRKSNFNQYSTYIVNGNVDKIPEDITVKKIKDKISSLKKLVKQS